MPTQIRIVETGSLDSRGAVQIAARAQNDHCGWEDAPAGATFVCLSGVPEGDERPVYVKTGDQVGQPTPVSVRSVYRYWTTPITALENIDYTPVSGSAVIEVGSSQTVIEVPTLDDTLDEFDEIFALGLEDVEGVGLFGGSRAYAVILISDNDPEPTLTIADDTAAEVDASLEFGVTLSAVSGKPITVEYATSDRTATAGNDYRATSGTLAFVAGEVAKTVAVPVLADQLPEADETMALTLSTIDNGNLGRGVATGTILDDDPALTVTGGEVAEADGTLAFAVTVTGGASTRGTVTVDYATSDGSATAGSDYTTTSGTLPFPPGVGERTVVVPVLDDRVEEGDETLTLTLTGPVNALIEGTAAVGTIRNDDLASTAIALSAVPVRVSEEAGATSVAVTATLNDSARGVETTVTVSVSGSGAAEAVDFAAVPDFAVTILAGAMSGTGTFTLKPEDDSLDEADERLSISGASNLPVTGTTLTLADDDLTTGILLTAAPSRVFEGAGPTLVTVTAALDGSARGVETTVTVLVSGSGAAEAVDFAAVPDFAVTILAGAVSGTGTFTLTPEDDSLDEADERLLISGASNLPVTGTTLTLADDDATSSGIVLTAMPSRVSEGAGSTVITVTATLDGGARTAETVVTAAVSGSGAAGAVDFATVPDFKIAIPAEATSGTGTFTLDPEDDGVDEADEALTVTGVADLPVTAATLTLADDDATSSGIVLAAMPSWVSEGAGSTVVTVTATLDGGARTAETVVTAAVSGSGAAGAVDFATVPDFKIAIPAEATSGTGTFTLDPEDDGVDEVDEALTVTGVADLPVTAAALTLADDDATSSGIVLAAMPSWVSEGSGSTVITVTATLDGAARTAETVVTAAVSGSGAAGAVDFATVPDFKIAIPAEATSGTGTFALDPEDDGVDEVDEALTVTGVADLPVTAAALTLADDDETSTSILLSVSPPSVSEGAGTTTVTVTATLDGGARGVETRVEVTVSGSGAADVVDVGTVPDFELVIPPEATSGMGMFTLHPVDDNVLESNETLTVAGAADLDVTAATVAVTDDDAASTGIALAAEPTRLTEDGGSVPVTVTAALNRAARLTATAVRITVSGSGAAGAVDFAAVADFEVEIAAGATSGMRTFTVTPEDDALDEAHERISIAGTSDLPVTGTTLSLADDDATATSILLSASPARVSEGAGATAVTVTATLDGSARTVETGVTVTVSGSGAADAVDFAAVADFEVEIAAGATSGTGTFTVTPEDDALDEAHERISIAGMSDLPVTGTTLTLADDDEETTRVLLFLSAEPPRASEGGGPVRVTVTAQVDGGVRPQATRVAVSVAGSGNPDAVDFASVAGFEITIAAGAASGSGTFTLTPEDDAIAEADETVSVSGISDLPVTPAALIVFDDDEASTRILLTADRARVSEGDGPVTVTVTAALDRSPRQQATAVTLSVAGSGDADAVDFAAVADFEIAIPAGTASGTGTFTLTPEDDTVAEADETVSVSGISDLPVTPAALIVFDDDEASTRILLTADRARVSEGDGPVTVTVTAALDRSPRQQATAVTLSVAGSGDADAVDFAAMADFEIAIPAGTASGTGTFTLTPEDDTVAEADETVSVSGISDLPVTPTSLTLADDDERPQQIFRVLLFESATNPARQGFLRVINHSRESGEVRIDAVDDGGVRRAPIMLAIDGGKAAHFNSDDLENGNADKGLSGGVGPSSRGEWRLKLSSDLDIEVLAYARTPDGFVTTMHDSAPVTDGEHRVSFFNPGRNMDQKSLLRLVNTGASDVEATISGMDDAGVASGEVRVEIPAGTVQTLSAAELESGIAEGIVAGALGAGTGKWRLTVSSPLPLAVKGLLTSPPGYLANLSTSPRTPGSAADTHGVPLFPSMSEPGREGVVRVVNRSAQAGEVRIVAMDDTAYEYEPVTLAVGAGRAAHFNSTDLELGNAAKGLSGSTGAGVGSWRLDLTSALDIEVLSYVRTADGFLTPVHDLAPVVDGAYRVAFFNPASNDRQVSRLRLINSGTSDALVTVTGVDDAGQSPGSEVRLRVAAGIALEVSSVALESGAGEGIESGAHGDGEGKWRLRVESGRPIQVMSLLDSPTGHLTDLSTPLDHARRP